MSPVTTTDLLTDNPAILLFFTGKGGVGKTALACATAIHLADAGQRVLLMSTHPASNLAWCIYRYGTSLGTLSRHCQAIRHGRKNISAERDKLRIW